jgi:hypothetical protein
MLHYAAPVRLRPQEIPTCLACHSSPFPCDASSDDAQKSTVPPPNRRLSFRGGENWAEERDEGHGLKPPLLVGREKSWMDDGSGDVTTNVHRSLQYLNRCRRSPKSCGGIEWEIRFRKEHV